MNDYFINQFFATTAKGMEILENIISAFYF